MENNWISVKDSLPEEGEEILFYVEDAMHTQSGYFDDGHFWTHSDEVYIKGSIHHWMKEPPPPAK